MRQCGAAALLAVIVVLGGCGRASTEHGGAPEGTFTFAGGGPDYESASYSFGSDGTVTYEYARPKSALGHRAAHLVMRGRWSVDASGAIELTFDGNGTSAAGTRETFAQYCLIDGGALRVFDSPDLDGSALLFRRR